MEGRVTAYVTHPLYDYACGEARLSYPPEWGIEEITRQFVYLKPDVFVVYDRLVLDDAAKAPCWMLHSLREPKASGAEKALTPEEIGPQFLFDGEKKPHPSPGGHFRMDGDSFAVESGSPGKPGGGWLAVQTLFPPPGECERRKIGGKGHDFEVGGVQYGLTDEGYAQADGGYAVDSTIGLLGWRVELRPKTPAKSVEFLHVMRVAAGAQLAPVAAKLSSSPEAHTVTVGQGARSFAVTLRRTGARGGSLKVAEGGKVLLDANLPEKIEDHWRNYRADPSFKAWMTDPRYRVIIEPTDEDRRLAQP
jgi:hypothetical protein